MPYQCKITLKYSRIVHIVQFKHVKTRYFLAFCLPEEVCILLRDNKAILRLIVFYVINCCYHVMIIEVALIFC